MLDRLKIRIPDIDDVLADELIKTATDRIILRAGLTINVLPAQLESICVEVVTAMYRRHEMQHEGVESESVDVFSVKFVNRLLDEYKDELEAFKKQQEDEEDSSRGVVRFI